MDWLDAGGVSWLGVLIAFVATMVFGFWFYSGAGLYRLWQRATGLTDDVVAVSTPVNRVVAFGGTLLANALGVLLLAVLMAGLGVSGWWQGLVFGLMLGLVFRAGAHAIHNGFAHRAPLVTVIDGLHDAGALAVAGLVLGLMQ